jgi:hypothetical protein
MMEPEPITWHFIQMRFGWVPEYRGRMVMIVPDEFKDAVGTGVYLFIWPFVFGITFVRWN